MPAPFPIDVDGNLGELALDVEAGFTGADAYVTFLSEEEASVRCEILFRNGPEQRRRRVRLSPGVPRLVTAGLRRNVVRLRINLTCDRE